MISKIKKSAISDDKYDIRGGGVGKRAIIKSRVEGRIVLYYNLLSRCRSKYYSDKREDNILYFNNTAWHLINNRMAPLYSITVLLN